jgi:hypothetical protein
MSAPESARNHKGDGMTNKDKIDNAELARLGVERVPADIFLWGGYRYGNARDAIAAAKRAEKA